VTQGVFAAVGDYFTWKLAERIYGHGSTEAWGAVGNELALKDSLANMVNSWH
jgi:hypothetical protein